MREPSPQPCLARAALLAACWALLPAGPVAAAVEVRLAASDAPDPATAGGDLDYRVALEVVGGAASGGSLSVALPAGTTFREVGVPAGWACVTPAPGATGRISCRAESVPAGEAVLIVGARIDTAVPSGAVLVASSEVAATGAGGALAESAEVRTRVGAAAAGVVAHKRVTGDFTPGGEVAYLVSLVDAGGGAEARLVDALADELELVEATASAGEVTMAAGASGVEWQVDLAPGGEETLVVRARLVAAAAPGAVVSNQARVSWDGDGDGSFELAMPTDDPTVEGGTDATRFTVVAAAQVPSAGRLGLALLTLALAGLGSRRLAG